MTASVCRSIAIAASVLTLVGNAQARTPGARDKWARPRPDRVVVLDGTSVHNVGELQMHFLNWGEWGSRPGAAEPYSLSPSAQWPAGSGVEYLFSAGLWVGAIRNGIPAVSTATFEQEFRPSRDARATVYRSREGTEGGNRPPSAFADDDEDGLVDEDRLDGYDNDNDGRVDEDYAAISTQMFTCTFADDEPIAREIYPEHNPLGIAVRQESYQWDTDQFDDFIAIEYTITNVGDDVLDEVFVGMFVDGDAGPRERSNYWKDDLVAMRSLNPVCTDLGPVIPSDVAYMYDADGDEGQTEGRFGVTVLGHPTDTETFTLAPSSVALTTFRYFSGNQAFQLGGDPNNDFERYELLAQGGVDGDARLARDYRMLVSTGPFALLEPGASIKLQFAFVCGGSEEALLANTISAQVLFSGAWFDVDGDPLTGVEGQETQVWGPQGKVWIDFCRRDVNAFDRGCDEDRRQQGLPYSQPIRHVPEGEFVWSNADCQTECLFKGLCGYQESDSLLFRSGVAGRETLVRWIVDTPPPAPNIRVNPAARDGVELYWDNFSEVLPDNRTQTIDFEGYRLWRAANWTREIGTSTRTGPPTDLWGVLIEADLKNGLGEDTGLASLVYHPLVSRYSHTRVRDSIDAAREFLREFPNSNPPCPQGMTDAECDTVVALAAWELELPGGRTYYRFLDRDVHEGAPYFYSVVAFDHGFEGGRLTTGSIGDPASNFVFVEPASAAQKPQQYDENEVYVVPNPVTRESMAPWALGPTNEDPSGDKLEFRNLGAASGRIRIYTLAGDLVQNLDFDASGGNGTVRWDLISRSGQSITSGIYLYSVSYDDKQFARIVGKFVVIR